MKLIKIHIPDLSSLNTDLRVTIQRESERDQQTDEANITEGTTLVMTGAID